jgi:large subunit ribosomal protein L18
MKNLKKQLLARRRRWRIRKKISGTGRRPRLSVRFTGQHIYVQFVDDEAQRTLASTSTRARSLPERGQLKANVESARRLGAVAAEVARAAGITEVVFDRSGARYHGKVKALADAAREGGLKF